MELNVPLKRPVVLSIKGLAEVELSAPRYSTKFATDWTELTTPPCFALYGGKHTLLVKKEYREPNNTLAQGSFTLPMLGMSMEVKVNFTKYGKVIISTPGHRGGNGWTKSVWGNEFLSLVNWSVMLAYAAGVEGRTKVNIRDLKNYKVFNAWHNAYKSFCQQMLMVGKDLMNEEVKDNGEDTLDSAFRAEDDGEFNLF